jgi:peroxiredoxin
MAAIPPICDFGWTAPQFELPATDGRRHNLTDLKGVRGTVIAFICNHCPYVKSIIGRLVRDASELRGLGVATIAINANDAAQYPEDDFPHMQAFASHHNLTFPYLHDETQSVARAFGAVCTPDFFGFNDRLELQYRGRLDASRKDLVPDARRDLFEAMKQVATTGRGPTDQIASMGCSIKWRND